MKKLVLLGLLLLSAGLQAAEPGAEQRGLAIAREADRRDTGWQNQASEMLMILRNKQGDESTRKIHNKSLEVDGDGDKALIVFDHPRDVKGTAFLSFTHATRPDDQWLYLPALKRVKRISSRNKSGPFMGSEFAFEDISSQEVEKYRYQYLRDETLDGHDTFVIERYPEYEHSGYTRQIVWLDKTMYQPLKIEFYDRKNELLKTLSYRDYRHYLDQYWRPDEMFMVNHQTGKSTTLKWSNYRFATGLTDRDFDQSSLKRAK